MPLEAVPAPGRGDSAGSFYRAVCEGCGKRCPPRALATRERALAHAVSRRWEVLGKTVLCRDCKG